MLFRSYKEEDFESEYDFGEVRSNRMNAREKTRFANKSAITKRKMSLSGRFM